MRKHLTIFITVLLICMTVFGVCFAADGAPQSVLDARAGVVRILAVTDEGAGSGSGFGIGTGDSVEFIVTNYHVVEGSSPSITVYSDGHVKTEATIFAELPSSDLAVLLLKDPLEDTAPLPLYTGSMEPNVGATVYALGLPGAADELFMNDITLEEYVQDYLLNMDKSMQINKEDVTLTSGLVSGARSTNWISSTGKDVQAYQIEVPINYGNSGGPLLNADGAVIGVNAFGVDASQAQNVNAAIAIEELIPLLRQNDIPYTAGTAGMPGWLLPVIIIAAAACVIILLLLHFRKKKKAAAAGTAIPAGLVPLEQYLQSKGPIPFEMALYLFAPVAHALLSYHTHFTCAPGVRPENIVVDPQKNRAYLLPGMQMGGGQGSLVAYPGYSPLEHYRSDLPEGTACDVYAFAALLYHALFMVPPPDALQRAENDETAMQKISSLPTSDQNKAAFTRAFCVDSAYRTKNAQELIQALGIQYYPDETYQKIAGGETGGSAQKQPLSGKKKRLALILGIVGAVAAVGIIFAVLLSQNTTNIATAQRLVEQERYAAALQKMDDLLFWDSSLDETYAFAQAGKALQEGDYDESLAMLAQMAGYPGVDDMVMQANYQKFISLMAKGEFGQMRELAAQLGNYEETQTFLSEINSEEVLENFIYGYWESDSGYYFNFDYSGIDTNIPGGQDEGWYELNDGVIEFWDDDGLDYSYEIWKLSIFSEDYYELVLVDKNADLMYTFYYAE